MVTGAGIKPIVESIEAIGRGVTIADQKHWELSAVSIGQVGIKSYESGRRDDFWKIEPLYFRPSAAEELQIARNADPLK